MHTATKRGCTDLRRVEAALLKHPAVDDCVVLAREADPAGQELVAYVVPAGPFQAGRLRDQLRAALPPDMVPRAYVPVASLPLTPAGHLDETALARLEVIDAALIEECQERLQAAPEVDEAVAVVRGYSPPFPPLHLADLLPGWQTSSPGPAGPPAAAPARSAPAEESGPRPLAVSHGGPLPPEPDAPATLPEALLRAIRRGPARALVHIQPDCSEIHQSYADLRAEAGRIGGGLRRLGLRPGAKVVFQLDQTQDFLAAFWGCVVGGFVPVPISIAPTYEQVNSTVSKLHNAWQMLDRPVVLVGKGLAPSVRSLAGLLGLDGFRVECLDDLRAAEPDADWHPCRPDDPALMLLTSGSTGRPKGVMLSHRNLLAMAAGTAAASQFTEKEVTLNWMPLDHVGAISFLSCMAVYLGCKQIHVQTKTVLEDPLRWLNWIERHRATISWAPNFAFGLINDRAAQIRQGRWDLSSMRFLVSAGEAVVAKTARRFLQLFRPHGLPSTALTPAFGMSETCSGITWSTDFSLETSTDDQPFVDVGPPIPGSSLRIVDDQGQVVPEGTVGNLQLKGDSLTSGYYQNPELNREVFTADGWFKTGDLGFLRDGRLTLTGRGADAIRINGVSYFSHEIETVVEEVEGVETSFTAACAVRDADSTTESLAVFFHTDLPRDDMPGLLQTIRGRVAQAVGVTPAYLVPLDRQAIPKTEIGKIQRPLLRRRFEAGEFRDAVRQADLLSANANTLPNWFFRVTWRRKEAQPQATTPQAALALVFLDRLGLGRAAGAELARHHRRCVYVEPGAEFAQSGPQHYRIDPREPEHYRRLVEAVTRDGTHVGLVLHLWTYDAPAAEAPTAESLERAQDLGACSVLSLAQALAAAPGGGPTRLLVVSGHTQSVAPDDVLACERTPVLGLIHTISQEMPALECRHLDLVPGRAGDNVSHVLTEVGARGDREVAYRQGQRLVPRLERVEPRPAEGHEPPFRTGGMYLLTGGLGGIGLELAKHLLTRHQARILLVGRTPLPGRDAAPVSGAAAERVRAYEALQALGGAVRYEAADVCDLARLREVVDRAQADWGCRLDGVIHLAGVVHGRLLAEETRETFAAVLRPKVVGTWALDQLVQDRPGAVFVGFSSVLSFFGGARFGAYAAANRFVEAFCHYQRRHSPLRGFCFAWSSWRDVGMSKGQPPATPGRAFRDISVAQGPNALLAGLFHGEAHLLIGLDGSSSAVRRHLEPPSCRLQQLTGYVTLRAGLPAGTRPPAPEVRDRFGTRAACDVVRVAEMPRAEDGTIDCERLAGGAGGRRRGQAVPPRTDEERRIAAIWQEVLGIPQLGVEDNFFELGGQSLLAAQVLSRLRDALGVELPQRALFEAPTVAGLAARVQAAAQAVPASQAPPLVPVSRDGELPLSFAQQRLWFIDQLSPSQSSYNLPSLYRLAGALDVRALEQALDEIVRRHEVLRTTFRSAAGRPVQVIAPARPVRLLVEDFRRLPEAEREERARAFARAEAQRPFELAEGPLLRTQLLRLGDQDHLLLVNLHHIVTDGWSMGVFGREVSALYEAFAAGRPSPLPELPVQYADYAAWQRGYLQGPVLEEQLAFWKEQLHDVPTLLELPSDRPRPPVQSYRGTHRTFTLSRELSDRLRELSRREGVTLFMTLMAAFQVLLHRCTGQERFIVSTGVANRDRRETESLIGCLINILLLRADVAGNPTFRTLLRRVRETALAAYAHQDTPFEKIVDALGAERDLSYHPLTQVMFVLLNAPMDPPRFPGLEVTPVDVESVAIENDIVLHVLETPDGLAGFIDYSTDLFDHETVGRMLGHFRALLEGIVARPEKRVLDLPLLTAAEGRQLLQEWNDTRQDFPADKCLHELFEAQAARAPEAPAVLFEDRCLTYGELDRRANQLAHHLRKMGVGPDVLVGLCVERSFEMVVGILGIMKAGGAYVPLDPAYPQERLRFMLEDTRAPVVVTQAHLKPHVQDFPARVVCLDAEWGEIGRESTTRPAGGAGPTHLSYVIYTSGSTGTPKGISIQHRGVVNNITDLNGRFGVGPGDRLLCLSSLSFDMCVYEVFGTLEAGAALVMPGQAELREPARWAELMRRHRVTVWNSAPALLKMLADYVTDRPELWPRQLHLAILGGDWVPVTLPDRLKTMAPHIRFIVLGGATEASIHSIIYPVERTDPGWKSIPYGKPQYNQKAYILNPSLQPVPVGVAGELYLGGIGLGRGYFNRPEQTAERFLPSPFATSPGERIYRTGDLARWMPDGNVELIGRMDYQVKLRGLRIECGEIEAVLRRHPAVREAVVAVKEQGGDKRLVGYVRPHGPLPSGARADELASELRGLAKAKLPDYMVPGAFVLLEQFPLSPNGKIDRKALPVPELPQAAPAAGSGEPCTQEEEILAGIWAQVLGMKAVGVRENFFDLGGHSLLATQVISQIRKAFQVELPLRTLFEAPTVTALADRVRTARQFGGGAQAPPLVPVPRDGELPLSFAQRRLWFIDQLLPGSPSYNIPLAFRLAGTLDADALERVLGELVRRHEVLRTTLPVRDGLPVQVIAGPGAPHLPVTDLRHLPEGERQAEAQRLADAEAQRPFDLAAGPLTRTHLIRLGEQDHLLLVTIHHIAADGWSLTVLSREVGALYGAFAAGRPSPLPELPVQYADYAAWQRGYLQGPVLEEQVAYWQTQLAGAPAKVELPADHPRPPVQTLRGARYFFELPPRLAEGAEALSRQEGTTLYQTLLALFNAFLHAYTGQQDLVVGSPFASRTRAETEGLIGPFVNTLVLRTRLGGAPTVRELLSRVREVVLGADAHQHLPFEKIVEVVRPPRDPSRNPLFQVNFRVVKGGLLALDLPGLKSTLHFGRCSISKFDLALELWVDPGRFGGFIEYSTDLFEEATIVRMAGTLERLLAEALANPDLPLSALVAAAGIATQPRPTGREPSRSPSLRQMRRKTIDLQ